MSTRSLRVVVVLLTAEAFAFGVTLALLIVPANALFLDAYGAEWLPATYIAIGRAQGGEESNTMIRPVPVADNSAHI